MQLTKSCRNLFSFRKISDRPNALHTSTLTSLSNVHTMGESENFEYKDFNRIACNFKQVDTQSLHWYCWKSMPKNYDIRKWIDNVFNTRSHSTSNANGHLKLRTAKRVWNCLRKKQLPNSQTNIWMKLKLRMHLQETHINTLTNWQILSLPRTLFIENLL